jgi:hypothetical protein
MYFLETIVDQNGCRKLAGGLDMPISEKRLALRAFPWTFCNISSGILPFWASQISAISHKFLLRNVEKRAANTL